MKYCGYLFIHLLVGNEFKLVECFYYFFVSALKLNKFELK